MKTIILTLTIGLFSLSLFAQKVTQGHLEIGFLGYEMADTCRFDSLTARMTANLMGMGLVTNYYFKDNIFVQVRTNEEGEIDCKAVNNLDEKIIYRYGTSEYGSYYAWDSSEYKLDIPKGLQKSLEMHKKLMVRYPYEEGGKEIMGFKCDKVVLRSLKRPFDDFKIVYVTEDLPLPPSDYGELGKLFGGCILEFNAYGGGMAITFGAISFSKTIDQPDVFSTQCSDCEEVPNEDFHSPF